MKKIICLLSLLVPTLALADYPSAMLNQNVRDEISDQNDRLIPRNNWFVAAVDGQGFARALGTADYYHGVGHWTQVRTEFSWAPNVAINMRSIFYSGTSSEGYAYPTGQYNLVSFSFAFPDKVLGGTLSFRVGDLDRQTVGTGLFVQERESNGGIILWDFIHSQFMLRQESSGWFVTDDDVSNPEIRFFDKKVGIGANYFWKKSPIDGDVRDPYHYIFTAFNLGEWDIGSEVGIRNGVAAGLLGVKKEFYVGGFILDSGVQARTYGEGFAEDIAGQIEHQYVSYDQYNKAYTSTMNIFAKDDNVNVYSAILNAKYEWNHTHRMGAFNEFANFQYKDINAETRYFYRVEYNYYPFPAREDHFSVLVSNKVFTRSQSYNRPPHQLAFGSVPLFRDHNFFGIEGHFRF